MRKQLKIIPLKNHKMNKMPSTSFYLKHTHTQKCTLHMFFLIFPNACEPTTKKKCLKNCSQTKSSVCMGETNA